MYALELTRMCEEADRLLMKRRKNQWVTPRLVSICI